MREALLCDFAESGAEARFVAGGGVGVQHAFLNRLINCRNGLAEACFGGLAIVGSEAFTEAAQDSAQLAGVGAVARSAFFCLTGALQRRIMGSHVVIGMSF